MKTEYLARLEKAMADVMMEFSENGFHPEYIHETLDEEMARAAALVYDACMAAQKFARAEYGDE